LDGGGLAWAYATITTSSGPHRVEIFDAFGGDDYDNPNFCTAGFAFDAFGEAPTPPLCNAVLSQSWSGELPCSVALSGLANQAYGLLVTASDGVVVIPSSDAESFTYAGESNLILNTDTCASGCQILPRNDCRTADRSRLLIKDVGDNAKDKLIWKWRRGEATSFAELGDPQNTADYAVCLYGGAPATLLSDGALRVPRGTTRWSMYYSTGWQYLDAAAAVDGVQRLLVNSGSDGRSRVSFKGKGTELPHPALPIPSANLPLTVQLINSQTPLCLESTFTAGGVLQNDAARFKSKSP
jgi:hypothetical protein